MLKKILLVFIILFLVLISLYWLRQQPSQPKKEEKEKIVSLYFLKDSSIVPVKRRIEISQKEIIEEVISRLLSGPSKEERKRGYFTEIPPQVKLLSWKINYGVAEANFSKNLGDYGGGSQSVQSLVAQIVYTLTEFPGVSYVKFFIEGKDEEIVLGGEGYIIDHPLNRKDVRF